MNTNLRTFVPRMKTLNTLPFLIQEKKIQTIENTPIQGSLKLEINLVL